MTDKLIEQIKADGMERVLTTYEQRILADAKIIKAAAELAYRAEAVFKSEYHNTKHIEGASAYYEANMATLTAYRAAVEEGRG